jgi:hypothetical protein
MKRCPTCNRIYTDESLNFCLADGAFLTALDDPNLTLASPTLRSTEPPTEILPTNQLPVNTNPVLSPTNSVREKIVHKRSLLPWLIAGALAVAFIIYLVIPKGSTPNNSNSQASSAGTSPTATAKAYYEAVIAKDVQGVKNALSKDSLKTMEEEAKREGKNPDDMLKEYLELGPKDNPPFESKEENITGDKATLKVKDRGDRWVTVNFVKEDGQWKLQR